MGIMYFHLKGVKKDFRVSGNNKNKVISFEEFRSAECHRRLRGQLNPYQRLLSARYAGERMQKLKYQLIGAPPRPEQVRMARLSEDLRGIDFKRDAPDPLAAWVQ